MKNESKLIRVSKESHETLRFLAYKNNESITSIIDRLLEGKVNLTMVEKILKMKLPK